MTERVLPFSSGSAPDGQGGLPPLAHVFDRIEAGLSGGHDLGILYCCVMQHGTVDQSAGWQAYETMVREIHGFLQGYRSRRMRAADLLVEPTIQGNAFVLLLGPPRKGRQLDLADLARVRARLKRGLREHLQACLPREVGEEFGCYVGAARLRPDDTVGLERIVYRSLEEAFADALRDREVDVQRHALQLHRVLELGLVHAVYQPVVDVIDLRVVGYEALTRVAPGRFETTDLLFKAATENDSLWSLERLCRRKALEGLPELQEEELLFLNVQPDAIYDPELRDMAFLSRLQEVGLHPRQIVLEMTEHSAVRDFPSFRRTLQHFRGNGFRLAMDDVGSGYSGLQAIAELAPDFIKADMGLVRDIHRNPIKRELIATIRRFSDSTGITLIAEGVETQEELRSLRELGVRCAQGFLFARPGAPPHVPDWDVLRPSPED
jgi:EAL domain-containing protein (putative c-di-GMP-specific phosphodiesterase class I)